MSPMLRAILGALFRGDEEPDKKQSEKPTEPMQRDWLEEARKRQEESGQRRERLLREGAIAAGGAGTAARLRRAEYEASRGPNRPAPSDASAAVEKWIRAGGGRPNAAQFSAAGVSEEEAEAKRAAKIAARRQRQSRTMMGQAVREQGVSSSTAVVRTPDGQYQAVTQVGDEPVQRSAPTTKEEAERIAEAARRRAMAAPLGMERRMSALRRALQLSMD